jgi:prepilin-type processing-associated H-X9-DG protein
MFFIYKTQAPGIYSPNRAGRQEGQAFHVNATATSVKALLSAVLGVLALGLLAFAGVPAVLLGLSALRDVHESDGRLRGRGLALVGMGLGTLGTCACLLFSIAFALLHVREVGAKKTCENNLRRIGQVVNIYHDLHGQFPAGTVPNATLAPEQRWSWQSSLLVFLDRSPSPDFKALSMWSETAGAIHLDKPWDDESNRPAVNTQLRSFVCPSYLERPGENEPGLTTYIGLAGVGADAPILPLADARAGVFGYDRRVKRADCEGGISNTMMMAETADTVGPWAAGGAPTVRGVLPEATPFIGVGRPWGGLHPGGAYVLMVDGSAVFISDSVAPGVFLDLTKLHRR